MTVHDTSPATAASRWPGGTRAVVEYLVLGWRRYLVSSLSEAVGAPLLYLLALGLGLGALVDRGSGGGALGGVGYLDYIAPALLTAAALQVGVGESAYPAYSRFKWTRVFLGISATPVSPRQIADGQLLFVALRVVTGAVLYYLVLLAFGAAGGGWGPLMVVSGTLTACGCAAWILALDSVLTSEGGVFNVLFRFVIVPMTLFSGSFFPVDRIPAALRWVAWVSPLWHGNELARTAALGGAAGVPAARLLLHAVVLLALLGTGVAVARRGFDRRLLR
ncbi:ABC transporter permease [Nakamurella endophytica]|uniref:Transport permease protein n=1 Tax=Nakamurella endophytica TaxID=1748367 RepID=A0A917SL69_9ACTN|nr:ABC transporter permease [Nakamurella endophytica]GGL84828.1 transport permease protein [Nakamurella endophytica]